MKIIKVVKLLVTSLTIICICAGSALNQDKGLRREGITQLDPLKAPLKEIGNLPKILKEASGLQLSKSKFLWSHNDDGIPAVYCLDTLGNLLRAVQLNTRNKGWEDLTADDNGNFYIGGFGNNTNDRKDLRIYIIPDPETITAPLTNPQVIEFSYSDQIDFPPDPRKKNFDVDAMIAWDDKLYLFTKDRSKPFTGYSKIYRLEQQPGKQTAFLIDSLFLGSGPMLDNWITGASLSPDRQRLALIFHDKVWFLHGFSKERFSSAKISELKLNHYSHKAGISFFNDLKLFIVDELEFGLLGGKLYSIDLTLLKEELTPK